MNNKDHLLQVSTSKDKKVSVTQSELNDLFRRLKTLSQQYDLTITVSKTHENSKTTLSRK